MVKRGFAFLAGLPALIACVPGMGQGKVYLHQEQALRQAFPEATSIERQTLFLTPEQRQAIEQQARVKVDSSLIPYYVGKRKDEVLGTAFFDTRLVRTYRATFMVVVSPQGTTQAVEILSFHEPEDYLPRQSWMRLLLRRPLTDGLRLRRDIPNVTGATLTCQTILDSVRGMLSIHSLIRTLP